MTWAVESVFSRPVVWNQRPSQSEAPMKRLDASEFNEVVGSCDQELETLSRFSEQPLNTQDHWSRRQASRSGALERPVGFAAGASAGSIPSRLVMSGPWCLATIARLPRRG